MPANGWRVLWKPLSFFHLSLKQLAAAEMRAASPLADKHYTPDYINCPISSLDHGSVKIIRKEPQGGYSLK
jgi:hypothetical protein